MTVFLIVVAVAVIGIVLWSKKARDRTPASGSSPKGLPGTQSPSKTSSRKVPPEAAAGATHHWKGSHFDFEIVGESHYQAQISTIAKRGDSHLTASLVLDPSNPYDNLAVRVDIGGQTVGYLSRKDARSFRRRLGAMRLTGQTTTCDAEIRGGDTARDGRVLMYGVFLAMKEFG